MSDKLKHIVVRPELYYELKKRGQAGESFSKVISALLAGNHCTSCNNYVREMSGE